MIKNKLLRLILSAFFLSLSYVLPFLTGQIPKIGSMLCPLHIPILLCGFVCGWPWGLVIGFIAPLLRSLTLGMPPLFPTSISMAFELATYGFVAGMMYKYLPKKKVYIYLSLLVSMLLGRMVWGITMLVCTGIEENSFTFSVFLLEAFVNAIPGIIIQIILIPAIIIVFENWLLKSNLREK